ncbi:MAG: NAD+ synthase [Candidatus Omnitrophica bacterium]|nr:NAD+ synthase [Candidatus Omnitrophota bacterium]
MKEKNIRIAIAQINCTVGDLRGNCRKIKEYLEKARIAGSDIVSFPELAVCGYPPEDLLLKPKFIRDNLDAVKDLAKEVHDIIAVVGFVDRGQNGLYNAAAVISDGGIKGIYRKMLLPNYGVFDEKRYFLSGVSAPLFKAGNIIFGVNICEDIWSAQGPTKQEARFGARLIVNINASPYHAGKRKERESVLTRQAKGNRAFITYGNSVGGQDELVFDGQSMVVDDKGKVIAYAAAFKEDLLIADLDIPPVEKTPKPAAVVITNKLSSKKKPVLPKRSTRPLKPLPEIYQALLLGLHDYAAKNNFQKVVVGLSGGIDSSFVATLASDALGKDNCIGVFMPTRYSSEESLKDAKELAQNLGIKFINIPIEQIYKMFLLTLEPHFSGLPRNIAEENVQARIRGTMLMALSNKFGWLVLATGNKSEMSTGYATLYGDMAGGFAVIKDVPKMLVYKLAEYRNAQGAVIPRNAFTKAPTAELRFDQKDADTLPVYDVLDQILKAYVEQDKDIEEIVSLGFDRETVHRVLGMVDRSEYKRRQAAPGIKITAKALGKDRRMPITNGYRP